MLKKCLIFLFILSISYLCPNSSKADPEANPGPAKDTCICYCSYGEGIGTDGNIHPDYL